MVKTGTTIGTVLGLASGMIYFNVGESGVPKESNATYLNPISTDIAAWIFGALLIYKGYRHNDPLIAYIGATVVSIHVSQFAAHKVLKNRNINGNKN